MSEQFDQNADHGTFNEPEQGDYRNTERDQTDIDDEDYRGTTRDQVEVDEHGYRGTTRGVVAQDQPEVKPR